MSRIARTSLVVVLGVAVAGLLLSAATARAQERSGPELAGPFQPWGTWVMQVQLPGPPAGPGGSLPMILTIHQEGTAVSSSSLAYGGLPGFTNWSSAVHDVWEKTGRRTLESTCIALSFAPGTSATQPGRLIGLVRNRLRLEAWGDGDHLVGEMDNEFLSCPTPTTCPGINDPGATWVPRMVAIPVTAERLVRVEPGRLVP